MRYTIAPLFCRPWTFNNMSPRLIESHYENNYGNALSRLNAVSEELAALGEQHPAGAAGERLSEGGEFLAPTAH